MSLVILENMCIRFPPDASLTHRNVLAALRTVQDVKTLGVILGISRPKRAELGRQSGSNEERREGLAHHFLQTVSNASWESLGGRLLRCGEDAALKAVKLHIKPDEGNSRKTDGYTFHLQYSYMEYMKLEV